MTQEELTTLSAIASDLLTGNHLLGRYRSDAHWALMREFGESCSKAENGETLTARNKELLLGMSSMFHGGMEDMCEQLMLDYEKVKNAVETNDKLQDFIDMAYEWLKVNGHNYAKISNTSDVSHLDYFGYDNNKLAKDFRNYIEKRLYGKKD